VWALLYSKALCALGIEMLAWFRSVLVMNARYYMMVVSCVFLVQSGVCTAVGVTSGQTRGCR